MISKYSFALASAAAAFCLLADPSPAQGSERHFTYTYETNVLNPGDMEIEPWTTYRFRRERFYSRFDQRLEFEVGLAPNLQTALYWNMSAIAADVDDGAGGTVRAQEFEFSGISNEWKYKLSDSFADALGSGLYFEWSLGPVEAELEAKILLDKRIGDFIIAYNLVGEHEWEYPEKGETEKEIVIGNVIGAGFFVTPEFVAGLELRSHTEIVEGEVEHTAFFGGPSLAYAKKGFWTALTILPQLGAIKGEGHEGEGNLDLHEHEKLEVRLITGFEL